MVGWREGGVGLVVYDGSVAFPLPAGRPAQLLPPCTHTPPMSPPTLLPPKHSTTKGECMGKETKLGAYKAQLYSRGILRTSRGRKWDRDGTPAPARRELASAFLILGKDQ